MSALRSHIADSAAQSELAAALADVRASLELPEEFPAEVLAEAAAATSASPPPERDRRDLEFLTIDPVGSMDLDQAMHLTRRDGGGYTVHYAIADVPGFVVPEGAVDQEARVRGQTLYAADGRIPLHPPVLSEDRISLLPGVDRSAYLWELDLDEAGAVVGTRLERAIVRSRERLSYVEAQGRIDAGTVDGPLALLQAIGLLRIEQERARGGASLNAPEAEIVRSDGGYELEWRRLLPVEDWNAQLSLMTGMEAAELMLAARVGMLRTMPAPDPDRIAAFRTQAQALGRPWPEAVSYGEYLRGLDRGDPACLAIMRAAGGLFRGAGYEAFDGNVPRDPVQSAIAAPYAHVTAPLRRLVDRWALVVCEAVSAGREVPGWARQSLAALPSLMGISSQRASRLESASVARVEAAVLADRVGERFDATVLELRDDRAVVQLADPPVTATCPANDRTRPGEPVGVVLESADISSGAVRFALEAA